MMKLPEAPTALVSRSELTLWLDEAATRQAKGPRPEGLGSDQANILIPIDYYPKDRCFQALYRTFGYQNKPHRELQVLEVDMIHLLQYFFAR